MKVSSIIIIISIVILTTGCKKNLNKEEYIKWVEDTENKLHIIKEMNQYVFDIQYKPSSYMSVKQKMDNNSNAINKSITNAYYFNLKIRNIGTNETILKNDLQNQSEFQERIYYYSYQFEKNIYLEINGSRIPCSIYHFERSYDLSPYTSFVLAFPKNTKTIENIQLCIDPKILNTGIIKFYFDKNILENIPNLKIE